jgi:fluoride exporter
MADSASMPLHFVAVGAGAAIGAWLRWGLAAGLNSAWPRLPLGTLTANLLGGFLVGIAAAYFLAKPSVAPVWRLFIVTGLLGGLTTFSTFSAEVVTLLQRGDALAALGVAALHLVGSLLLTALGFALYRGLAA